MCTRLPAAWAARLVPAAALLAPLGQPVAARAGLLANGSFETPVVPAGFYTNFPAGSTAVTGWTVVGVDSAVTSGAFVQSGITFRAQDGGQWIDLAGIDSNSTASGVTQDVATTPGQAYLLSFHVGSATDGMFFFPTTVDLSIDGGPRVGYTNPAAPTDRLDWKGFTVSFTATGTTTNLTFFNGGAANNYLNGLDNVSLVPAGPAAVPEPASLGLAAAGVAGLVGYARRRRAAPA